MASIAGTMANTATNAAMAHSGLMSSPVPARIAVESRDPMTPLT